MQHWRKPDNPLIHLDQTVDQPDSADSGKIDTETNNATWQPLDTYNSSLPQLHHATKTNKNFKNCQTRVCA